MMPSDPARSKSLSCLSLTKTIVEELRATTTQGDLMTLMAAIACEMAF